MNPTLTPEALQRAMTAACKAGEYAELPTRVYDALIAGWEELRTAPTVPGVAAADLHLAAQMLTWGREDGLTEQQQKDIEAHQRKLFAALGSAGAQPQAEQRGAFANEREVFAEWHRRKGCSQQIIDDCLSGSISMPALAADLVQMALAARQPVGEPVAWKYQDKAADGVWEERIGERLPCWEHRNPAPLYAIPPAQAWRLGQFRKAVEAWKRDAENKHRAGEIFPEQKEAIWNEADRLLALIDSKAVRNGVSA